MLIDFVLDLLLFKLAFHTYEALKNKTNLKSRSLAKSSG